MDCLFCKIVEGSIPAKKVYEDEQAIAFEDIHPQAPTHVLVVPKKHIPSLDSFDSGPGRDAEDKLILGHLHALAAGIARERNLTGGYRTVVNSGPDAGQTVFHLHVHLLGGRKLEWPPG